MTDAQSDTTEPYPSEPTVEIPVALLDFIGFYGASIAIDDGSTIDDNETLAQIGWALFKEVNEHTPSDDGDSMLTHVDRDDLLVKHAGTVGYDLEDVDIDTDDEDTQQ